MSTHHRVAMAQHDYRLSERLIRAISGWMINPKDTVESVLEEGADVNRPHGTLLPLQCSCMRGDVDIVKLILEHGGEVNAVDGYSRTALHYAAEQDVDCVTLLLDCGADPNALSNNEETPIHWAAFRSKSGCLQTLLERQAAVNVSDIHGNTPLSWAAMKGNYECVQLLLEYGAEPHTVSHDGATPISRVAGLIAAGLDTENERPCLDVLIRASGQFDVRDEDGMFSRSVADDTELCDLLRQHCCQPRPLRQQCRYAVRHCLSSQHMPNVVKKLPIPAPLQRYLLLQT
ncbi:ankyrin repeat and SOCS box protein 8-like [Diadema antillarum]|uniref:ankyrin repeat and SOCS box protein 8-like n=1 Tax=Diadema antillarum TaxID=105358 RepID=UPI003A88EBEE